MKFWDNVVITFLSAFVSILAIFLCILMLDNFANFDAPGIHLPYLFGVFAFAFLIFFITANYFIRKNWTKN